ncbi:MAG: hypothetical protein IJJ44_08280 [Solobacterium sp.]|nr:hypothetical protein [Solobacterium sp.]
MKLQLAEIFGEHMVFQQHKEIPVWGRSAADDEILVELGEDRVCANTDNGFWKVVLPPQEPGTGITLKVASKVTGEVLQFTDIAVGEVWLAGGQSNMEFIMKYDVDAEEMKNSEDDPDLRFFCFPQTPFLGYLEKEPVPEQGFWRRWEGPSNKIMFSAVGAYMARILRKELRVPVGIIGCNWGGTPASAWTAMEDLKNNEKLSPVLEEYENNCSQIDWRKYIETSELPVPVPDEKQREFNDRFMMGEDMTEFFKNLGNLPKPDISIWGTYPIAPRSATRPSGLYEMMLKRVAPYALKGFLWYQGEDDDARDWADFYDESMKTMIQSWRRLWAEELPFFQVELAPFRGVGITGAKKYAEMRHLQHKVSLELADVHDICILDAGEEFNIHPRHKRLVGERLGRSVMRHVYGNDKYIGDCPSLSSVKRGEDCIEFTFDHAEGLHIRGDLHQDLFLYAGERSLEYEAEVTGEHLVLKGNFRNEPEIQIRYCEENYCVAKLFNSEGDPVYGFTCSL